MLWLILPLRQKRGKIFCHTDARTIAEISAEQTKPLWNKTKYHSSSGQNSDAAEMAPTNPKVMRRLRFKDLLFEEDQHIHSSFENLLAIVKKLAKDFEGKLYG